MRGEKNMKKIIPFIIALLVVTACSNQVVQSAQETSKPQSSDTTTLCGPNLSSAHDSEPSTSSSSRIQSTQSTNAYMPYQPIEGQVNRPNKAYNSKVTAAVDTDYTNALQQFALDYYELLENNKNQVFSPLSIATCYSMLYEGTDGKTKQELEHMLHYDGSFDHIQEIQNMLLKCAIRDSEKNVYLDIAQSVWLRSRSIFKNEYLDKLTNDYYAEAFDGISFETTGKQQCADWVNGKTNNFLDVKASDFDSFTHLTMMVLFNTIYLKAPWLYQDLFREDSNRLMNFTNIDNSQSNVTFMNGILDSGRYYAGDNYMIASLPLAQGMKFNVLLPNKGNESVLTDRDIVKKLFDHPNYYKKEPACLYWSVPQFKIKEEYDLLQVLANLGLEETFSENPNFANMAVPEYKNDLFIKASKHVAGIELSNAGVEAAAYTYIQVDSKALPGEPIDFILDHPFAYSITTPDGYPLFMGMVNQL